MPEHVRASERARLLQRARSCERDLLRCVVDLEDLGEGLDEGACLGHAGGALDGAADGAQVGLAPVLAHKGADGVLVLGSVLGLSDAWWVDLGRRELSRQCEYFLVYFQSF